MDFKSLEGRQKSATHAGYQKWYWLVHSKILPNETHIGADQKQFSRGIPARLSGGNNFPLAPQRLPCMNRAGRPWSASVAIWHDMMTNETKYSGTEI
jgi:hypothetical protein